jgi:hypothetical protein
MPIRWMFIHGNAVRMASIDHMMKVYDQSWSDILGLPGERCNTFRSRREPDHIYPFYAPIPTPAWYQPDVGPGSHCRLKYIGFKFTTDPDVQFEDIRIASGNLWLDFMRIPPFGGNGDTWIENRNYFEVPGTPTILDALNITFLVRFLREGNVTFHAVGAGFEVAG